MKCREFICCSNLGKVPPGWLYNRLRLKKIDYLCQGSVSTMHWKIGLSCPWKYCQCSEKQKAKKSFYLNFRGGVFHHSLSLCLFLAMCSFSALTQDKSKYISGQSNDSWCDLTSWKNELGRPKRPWERKGNKPFSLILFHFLLPKLLSSPLLFPHPEQLWSSALGMCCHISIYVTNVFMLLNFSPDSSFTF